MGYSARHSYQMTPQQHAMTPQRQQSAAAAAAAAAEILSAEVDDIR